MIVETDVLFMVMISSCGIGVMGTLIFQKIRHNVKIINEKKRREKLECKKHSFKHKENYDE